MKKTPKILMIGTTDIGGGAAMAGWKLAEGLRKKGYWVRHIVGYKHSNSSHVSQLPTRFGKSASLHFRHLRSYILANDQDFGFDQEIFNHPWYKKTDIVHLHNTHGNYISLEVIKKISHEKKLVWTLHDMWSITSHCAYTKGAADSNHDPLNCDLLSYPPMLWDNRKRLWEKKQGVLENSKITYISSSEWLMRKFKKTFSSSKNTLQIYNGVDVGIFRHKNKSLARKKLNLEKNMKIGLFIAQGGKKDKRKGFEYLQFLSQEYTKNLFLVVGGKKSYQDKNIKYISKTSNLNDLSNYYNAADVLIFPSLADNNPQVVLEAYSCRLPTLGFDACGTTELIQHKKNGYLAKFKDRKDLKKGYNFLMTNQSIESSFSKKFSIDKMVSQHTKLYKRA